MGGAIVREASATTTTGQALAQPELRRVFAAVPPSRREPASRRGTISRPPHWSFGGQGRKPANIGIQTKTRTMDVRASLHWSRHIASTATTSCLQYCLSDTALTASSFVIDLFNANTDVQRLFLNGCFHCARLYPFSDDTTIFFDENSRDVVHLGKWSDPRRNALATNILALSWQKSSTSAKCEHHFKDFFLSRQTSRIIFVETLCTANFDQQVRVSGHAPECFWITLEKDHSSCFRRTV